ncbi:MAG: single-stranded DNA-binding protein [Oscillospiraceae bacterium]|nr:single-stranded DNA-binding protein [Oscillospiraceae bacterium]
MENCMTGNLTRLCGNVNGRPVFSHYGRSRKFYVFPLSVPRLSGAEDVINIVCGEEQLKALEPDSSTMLKVTGELRSYNNKSGVGNRLLIFVYANEMTLCEAAPENLISLRGTLCKRPVLRTTPLGREICDILIAVNRPFGRSDYLPCISWGQNAREAARWSIGDMIELEGRVQSRNYVKSAEGRQVCKTAFEVSSSSVRRTEPDSALKI